jgi:hypothetical protein
MLTVVVADTFLWFGCGFHLMRHSPLSHDNDSHSTGFALQIRRILLPQIANAQGLVSFDEVAGLVLTIVFPPNGDPEDRKLRASSPTTTDPSPYRVYLEYQDVDDNTVTIATTEELIDALEYFEAQGELHLTFRVVKEDRAARARTTTRSGDLSSMTSPPSTAMATAVRSHRVSTTTFKTKLEEHPTTISYSMFSDAESLNQMPSSTAHSGTSDLTWTTNTPVQEPARDTITTKTTPATTAILTIPVSEDGADDGAQEENYDHDTEQERNNEDADPEDGVDEVIEQVQDDNIQKISDAVALANISRLLGALPRRSLNLVSYKGCKVKPHIRDLSIHLVDGMNDHFEAIDNRMPDIKFKLNDLIRFEYNEKYQVQE